MNSIPYEIVWVGSASLSCKAFQHGRPNWNEEKLGFIAGERLWRSSLVPAPAAVRLARPDRRRSSLCIRPHSLRHPFLLRSPSYMIAAKAEGGGRAVAFITRPQLNPGGDLPHFASYSRFALGDEWHTDERDCRPARSRRHSNDRKALCAFGTKLRCADHSREFPEAGDLWWRRDRTDSDAASVMRLIA